jgi:hypothetical protein
MASPNLYQFYNLIVQLALELSKETKIRDFLEFIQGIQQTDILEAGNKLSFLCAHPLNLIHGDKANRYNGSRDKILEFKEAVEESESTEDVAKAVAKVCVQFERAQYLYKSDHNICQYLLGVICADARDKEAEAARNEGLKPKSNRNYNNFVFSLIFF